MRSRFPDRSLAISRTLDATQLNDVANHPNVRPWLYLPEGVTLEGPLHLERPIGDPRNYTLQAEHGGFVGVAQGYGRYEVHSLFLPQRSSGETIRTARAAIEYMFTRTDCWELVTKVPEGNKAAGQLASAMWFEERFVMPTAPDITIPARYLSLSIDQWAAHACGVAKIGEWFHDTLEQAKRESGSKLPVHADDAVHDQMAGAAVLMVYGGQAEKAVAFYNRWARWAGYAPLSVISVQPAVLDIGDAVIEARGDEMEVLLCR